ncbi:MAG TPA: sorbosone dehydrogenase family protein [Pyrinomonadaceae bacterium]|nr:sorbosone dehydrogenase family protein [Pyrinomonadaceae bacterium]
MRKKGLTALVSLAALASAALLVAFGDACSQQRREAQNVRPQPQASPGSVLAGQGSAGDWTTDAPGVRHRITPADLPQPYATRSVDAGSRVVKRPEGSWPQVPAGFKVEQYATGLSTPRLIRTAPNGDLFVAESYSGSVRVLRGAAGKAETSEVFAADLHQPFGIAFYPPGPDPQYVYVADTDAVLRFPYRNGDLKARGRAETIVPDLPGGGRLRGGGHWTRDIAFSPDGKKMFVSVGSMTNDYEDPDAQEEHRADILQYNPDGTGFRLYATGIRNAVGIAINSQTGDLWASVNERDGLGDDLVPDYVTRVRDGGFYGWPWYYIGPNQDPRHKGEHTELRDKITVPDVLIQSHSASLEMTFYAPGQFPREYTGDAFAAEHGSWNRGKRTGYKVIRVLLRNGVPTGEYEDFMTGFLTPAGDVWGRPVGVAEAKDGSLLVSDDGSNTIWRISYAGK